MARARVWENLSPGYRKRLERNGISKNIYENKLRSLSAARGHANTPEHGIREARKQPARFRDYLRRKEPRPARAPAAAEKEARELNRLRDAAYENERARLREYHKYNDVTVRANVYGGETSESGPVPGMSAAEARWTGRADTEELRSRAREQYTGNPWWYH